MSKQNRKKQQKQIKVSPVLLQIQGLFQNEKYKECDEIVQKEFKSEGISMDILMEKIKIEQ